MNLAERLREIAKDVDRIDSHSSGGVPEAVFLAGLIEALADYVEGRVVIAPDLRDCGGWRKADIYDEDSVGESDADALRIMQTDIDKRDRRVLP